MSPLRAFAYIAAFGAIVFAFMVLGMLFIVGLRWLWRRI